MQSDMELTEELDIILIYLEIYILYCSIWYSAEAFGILPHAATTPSGFNPFALSYS